MFRLPVFIVVVSVVFSTQSVGQLNSQRIQAKDDSDENLKEFVLHPDCQIELVARDPQVIDPIAIRFDERGRMWVVEMRDYPMIKFDRPLSTIKILEDRDRDGFFETAFVFADKLRFPTGIQPWRNGVIVTLEGQVVYLADNDGDNRCDEEKILFRGFATQNTQLRANHPTLGPDGKIYVANGLRNGEISSPYSTKKLSLTGMDFRFDPHTLEFDLVTGHGQFGMTFDSAGKRFVCTNRNPLKRIVFEAEYLRAAKGIRISQTLHDVAAAGPDSRLFPISETWTTSNLHANQFTAACGVHVYEGSQLPPEMLGNAFTCDPTANVVHREVISYAQDEVVGRGQPGRMGVEFLASSKPEFRPVNLNSGPDGSLYVVDMRRAVIEHPQFMPPELKQRPDLRIGNDLGRIYRIRSKSSKASYAQPKLNPSKHLFDRSGWWREQAHRLMIQNPEVVNREEVYAGLSRPESHPNGIIRALSWLAQQDKFRPIDYQFAVSHYSSAVRAFAMQLCEGRLPDALRAAITDESDRVRFQALLSCVKSGVKLTTDELKTVAVNSAQNEWVKQALLIAAQGKPDELLEALLLDLTNRNEPHKNQQHILDFANRLVPLAARLNLKRATKLAQKCLQEMSADHPELEPLGLVFLQQAAIRKSLATAGILEQKFVVELRKRFQKEVVFWGQQNPEPRFLMMVLIGDSDFVASYTQDKKDPAQKLAAMKAMQFSGQDDTWLKLVDEFRSLPFSGRAEILKACIARAAVAKKLLSAIEQGSLKTAELGLDARRRLLAHRDPEVKKLAGRILALQVPQDRKLAFEKYKKALTINAEASRGKPIFEKTCAACHRLGALGNQIGPDISDTRTKSKSQLLLDIIRPNAAIDNNYIEYLVATTDGRSVKGIIVENNATGMTLKQADNKTVVVGREEIEQVQSTGKSLMPIGLEQGLSEQQVADLISFLQNWRYLEQNIPFAEDKNAK